MLGARKVAKRRGRLLMYESFRREPHTNSIPTIRRYYMTNSLHNGVYVVFCGLFVESWCTITISHLDFEGNKVANKDVPEQSITLGSTQSEPNLPAYFVSLTIEN